MKQAIDMIEKAKSKYVEYLEIVEESARKYGYIKGRSELIAEYTENIQKIDNAINLLRGVKDEHLFL